MAAPIEHDPCDRCLAGMAMTFKGQVAKAHCDGIVAFSQTDFAPDLKKVSVPTLVMHEG